MPKHSDFHRERTTTTTHEEVFQPSSRAFVVRAKKASVYEIKVYEMGSDNRYMDFSIVRWASFILFFIY